MVVPAGRRGGEGLAPPPSQHSDGSDNLVQDFQELCMVQRARYRTHRRDDNRRLQMCGRQQRTLTERKGMGAERFKRPQTRAIFLHDTHPLKCTSDAKPKQRSSFTGALQMK
ncbi:hypothetical protein NDU88_001105 [Pleurodeles waltl]|uniref:Uncharacterized protein n=1 Tax=Pleurodeles waltl TaxID=8319 RepID=A0AAV7P614_PLEWA|nr:hypothetical protein NDU88_001105 [Pleurodeles waltl]